VTQPLAFSIVDGLEHATNKRTAESWPKPGQLSLDQLAFEKGLRFSDGPGNPPQAVRVPEQLSGKKSKKTSSELRKKSANGPPKPLKPASPSPSPYTTYSGIRLGLFRLLMLWWQCFMPLASVSVGRVSEPDDREKFQRGLTVGC